MTDTTHDPVAEAKASLPGEAIFDGISGSHLYGVANDQSDIDWKFVYVLPTEQLLGLNPPTEKKLTCERKSEEGNFEWVGHEVGKYARLLIKGNPSMVEMLYLQGKIDGYTAEPLWQELIAHRKSFLSKQVGGQYLGYIIGQLDRLKKAKSLHTTSGEYNTKWAYHMVRLSWDLLEIIEGRDPTVNFIGAKRNILLSVRAGQLTKPEIIEMIENFITNIKKRDWQLPEQGDSKFLHEWLLDVRNQYGKAQSIDA